MTLATFKGSTCQQKSTAQTPLRGGVGSGDVRYDGNPKRLWPRRFKQVILFQMADISDFFLETSGKGVFFGGGHWKITKTNLHFLGTGKKTQPPNLQRLQQKSSPPLVRCKKLRKKTHPVHRTHRTKPPKTAASAAEPGGDIRAIKVIKKPSCSEGLQTVSNEAGGEVDDL